MFGRPIVFALLTVMFSAAAAVPAGWADVIPDRRREQFLSESAHLFAPLPYSLPGIGSGLFLLGNFSNMFESPTDLFAVFITGDAEGTIAVVDELPLLSRHLLLQAFYQDITKAAINSYDKRGMQTDKDDFNVVELNSIKGSQIQLTLNFFQRRLELNQRMRVQSQTVVAIRDSEGEIITRLDEPVTNESDSATQSLRLDFTDDRQDPRAGLRLEAIFADNEAVDVDDADFSTLDLSALFYIPVGEISTWIFHYYQSDASVSRQGNTDRQQVIDELGANCAAGDTECLEAEQSFVDNTIAARTSGTATSLGGNERLRSYPQGRFRGAHMAFYGSEFRWNLSDEATPFDIFFWKDVRTSVQIAFFAETGTVAETRDQLWDDSRQSYGSAIRLISSSGNVYKAEVATGDEGTEFIVFFFYPWN